MLKKLMNVNSNRWLLPLLVAIILILFGYFAVDYYNHLSEDSSCQNPGSGMGQGRVLSQTYYLLILIALSVCALIPILYYLISRNLKIQLERNMKIISEIVNNNVPKSKKEDTEKSSKILFLKFLSYGENKVIKKLIENNGTVLQSEISRMPNMGKVRTHRIVTDLKRKGIITIEKYGKTNRINLTDDSKNVLVK